MVLILDISDEGILELLKNDEKLLEEEIVHHMSKVNEIGVELDSVKKAIKELEESMKLDN